MLEVVFLNEKGERVYKFFDSEFLAKKFVEKLKRSKRCTLVSYPIFG